MNDLRYWVWLTTRKGISNERMRQLLDQFGSPMGVYFAQREHFQVMKGLGRTALESLSDKDLGPAEEILDRCDWMDIRPVTIRDPFYPARLAGIPNPPVLLYWKGRALDLDQELVITMVGTRSASKDEVDTAFRLASELSRAGVLVLSGMAKGIDGASLRGALSAGGRVAAVLGCGLDVIYPKEHEGLYADVAESGALISEYPPGTRPVGSNFPWRNRILSGLAEGVLAVASPINGGAMITVNHALQQGRKVFAVPGGVREPNAAGPNELLRANLAQAVSEGGDVLSEFSSFELNRFRLRRPLTPEEREARALGCASFPEEGGELRKKRKPKGKNTPESKTGEDVGPSSGEEMTEKTVDNPGQAVYIDWKDCQGKLNREQIEVLRTLDGGSIEVDELAERTGIPSTQVLSALTVLQVMGYVAQLDQNTFRGQVRIRMG